jgi:hypothetical protein
MDSISARTERSKGKEMIGQAKPAGVSGGHRELQASNWKAIEKNTLRGFASLKLPCGLIIHNCSLHEQNGSRWIGMPGGRYQKADGETAYAPAVEFSDRESREEFRISALRAIDQFREEGNE